MIVLKVVSTDRNQIEEIAVLLLQKHLAIDIDLKTNVERLSLKDDQLQRSYVHELSGKTKALLFPGIDKMLVEEYGERLPEVYSVPIIHMDWDQTLTLRQEILDV